MSTARDEFEEARAGMAANLAAHVRAAGHPLAAAVLEGNVNLGIVTGDEEDGLEETVTEDQATGALELGEAVVVWRPRT